MQIKDQVETLIVPLLEAESAELVDLSYAKEGPNWMLRLFLDKQGGITLDDCAYFSDRIGSLLDTSGVMRHGYVLEVSSPGLDRVIKKEKDFQRFSGKAVTLRLKVPEQGQRKFRGTLRGMSDGKVRVDCEGRSLELPPSAIDEMRLDYAAEV